MRKLGSIGDVNPIEYGGGYVFEDKGQQPWIEYTYGLEDEPELSVRNTTLDTWFERDRAHVALYVKPEFGPDDKGDLIVEWWDEDVAQAVEDGFLDPRDWHGSAFSYAQDMDLLAGLQPVQVYRIDVEDDVFSYHDWAKIEDIARGLGQDPEELLASGRSHKIMDRAWATETIAAYYGWHELDQYPETFTVAELEKRWKL